MCAKRKRGDIHGVLLVDKPTGMTSFDVIRRMRRVLHTRKIGHAGTLDPFASGVLVLCVGDYTRFAGYLTAEDKRYRAHLQLGEETNTDDLDGETVQKGDVPADCATQLASVLPRFRGKIDQIPPLFSAIHIDGKRAYKLAREGKDVAIPARSVVIASLQAHMIDADRVELLVEASKGTYIRALGRDIGRAIGCGGHLCALRRLRSGAFEVDAAQTLDELERTDRLEIPMLRGRDALRSMPSVTADNETITALIHGKTLPAPEYEIGVYAVYEKASDALIGLVEVFDEDVPIEEPPLGTDTLSLLKAPASPVRKLRVRRLMPTG